jgi:hypothetical protein
VPDRQRLLAASGWLLCFAAVAYVAFAPSHPAHWTDAVTAGAVASGLLLAVALFAIDGRRRLFVHACQGLLLAVLVTLAAAGLAHPIWKFAVLLVALMGTWRVSGDAAAWIERHRIRNRGNR